MYRTYEARAELGEKYILLPGTKGCIYLVNADDPQTIIKSIGLLESLNPDSEDDLRTLLSASSIVEADAQGRFKLPDNLITFANIKKDIWINGNISKVEIWSDESWCERNKRVDSTPSGIDEIYRSLSAKRNKRQ